MMRALAPKLFHGLVALILLASVPNSHAAPKAKAKAKPTSSQKKPTPAAKSTKAETKSEPEAKKKRVVYKSHTELDLTGDTIQGRIRAPEVFYIFQRKRADAHHVVQPPRAFDHHQGLIPSIAAAANASKETP